jgi:membrane protein DedA with SNARE-associated domain
VDYTGSRPHWAVLGVPIAVITVLGVIGTALTPPLAAHHPLVLLILEARDRNLLLARHVSILPFVVVSTLRRLCSDPLFYLLGHHYGPSAVDWLKRHHGGSVVGLTERAFRRAAYPMLVIFPGAVVCILAGDIGIPPVPFGVIVVIRTIVVVVGIRYLGDVFAQPIDGLLSYFNEHLIAATAATIAIVILWIAAEQLRHRRHDQHPDRRPAR